VLLACWCIVHGAVADKKILVHPESIIAVPSAVAVKMAGVQSKVNENLSSLRSITLVAPPHNYFPHATYPMVLSLVAVSSCPSFLTLQVALMWSL
jgi:hypothetical protein